MGATTRSATTTSSTAVYAALDRFERHLADHRYLVGDTITDADLLLYVQLVRFDTVAVPLGRLTRKRLVDLPNLWAYARDLYQRPAFGETNDLDHIVRGTFMHRRRDPHQPDRPRAARSRLGRAARSRGADLSRVSAQELGEAELVAVGVAQVEVALTPRRVGG